MLSEGDRWPGYSVSLAGDDRKYHVRRDRDRRGAWNVAVKIRDIGPNWRQERWIFSERVPGKLVAAINRVARRFHDQKGGSFYINEHSRVLKPTFDGEDVTLHYVGEFPDVRLEFPLDDALWTVGPAVDSPPAGLTPGDDWFGPRCGIPYWITRRRGKIYRPRIQWYENDFVRREDRDYLDEHSSGYRHLSSEIQAAKNGSGGKFYVNGSGYIFTPYQRGSHEWGYAYVGRLWNFIDPDAWFPKTNEA